LPCCRPPSLSRPLIDLHARQFFDGDTYVQRIYQGGSQQPTSCAIAIKER
jgi:hypothetical protein